MNASPNRIQSFSVVGLRDERDGKGLWPLVREHLTAVRVVSSRLSRDGGAVWRKKDCQFRQMFFYSEWEPIKDNPVYLGADLLQEEELLQPLPIGCSHLSDIHLPTTLIGENVSI